MSRSYREPYGTHCCMASHHSTHNDKRIANRTFRKVIRNWIRLHTSDEEFDLVPHRYECRHNDVWGWNCDGPRHLRVADARDWSHHCLYTYGFARYGQPLDREWPPTWSILIRRK